MNTNERTLVFIKPKPDGMPADRYDEGTLIKKLIALANQAGLRLLERFASELTPDAIATIYCKTTPARLIGATQSHMQDRVVNVFIFQGENATRMMSLIVGDNPNPALCSTHSLRYEWWNHTKKYHVNPTVGKRGLDVGDRLTYWFNFLHCSRTKEEYERDRSVLEKCRVQS